MRLAPCRPTAFRRGLTLVEMLVTVALLLMIMTIVVQIFRSATSAMTTAQTDAELAATARRFEATLRQDLTNVIAKFTPPPSPHDKQALGYFEYGEGEFADTQGEDTDDYIAMTVQAPEGQPFTGRIMLQVPGTGTSPTNPPRYRRVTTSSRFAEVLYFLRNGNLYRRVLLVNPDQAGLVVGIYPSGASFRFYGGGYESSSIETDPFPGQVVSWQGMNDFSAHASAPPPSTAPASYPPGSYIPIPNTLADLTRREYRMFRPRFVDDYVVPDPGDPTQIIAVPDGKPDDLNRDSSNNIVGNNVPDYYPTLYPNALTTSVTYTYPNGRTVTYPLVNDSVSRSPTPTLDTLAFPYVFPGAFSQPNPFMAANRGLIHDIDPGSTRINHSPLEIGDSLSAPSAGQTWWCFPTWKETLSEFWTSPIKRINDPTAAPYFANNAVLTTGRRHPADLPYHQGPGLSRLMPVALPPVADQLFSDGAGVVTDPGGNVIGFVPGGSVFEEDVLVRGVRSFDVKAFDENAAVYGGGLRAGYYDLGYAGLTTGYPLSIYSTEAAAQAAAANGLRGFGHEGRIPPLVADYRADARNPALTPNIGDNDADVVRLRRVWDSWSTTYTNAPATGIDPNSGLPTGVPYSRPIYPSYPAPYPAPLRGIQIQVRVVDPRNERVKVLTIRHDFSDKL